MSRGLSPFAVDLADDLVGGFGPDEEFAPLVPAVDERLDGGDEVFDAGERSTAYCLAGDDAEEDLDHVEPAAAGRGEVHRDAGVAFQPRLDPVTTVS